MIAIAIVYHRSNRMEWRSSVLLDVTMRPRTPHVFIGLYAREYEQVNIAPVILLAAAQRTDEGYPGDRRVGLQQFEQLVEEAVTERAQQRWSLWSSGGAGQVSILGHNSFSLPARGNIRIVK